MFEHVKLAPTHPPNPLPHEQCAIVQIHCHLQVYVIYNIFSLLSVQAGKRLVFRSEPPQRKQKENKKKEGQDKEEEEKAYFFT